MTTHKNIIHWQPKHHTNSGVVIGTKEKFQSVVIHYTNYSFTLCLIDSRFSRKSSKSSLHLTVSRFPVAGAMIDHLDQRPLPFPAINAINGSFFGQDLATSNGVLEQSFKFIASWGSTGHWIEVR